MTTDLHTAMQVGSLKGNHEEVVELLASHPLFDGEVGNPIYYAVHFRNTVALASLLKHTKKDALAVCLEEVDAHNETVLHVSARSKSSGFTRLFVTTEAAAQKSGDVPANVTARANQTFRTETMDLLGTHLPAPAHHGGWQYSASDLTNALSTTDLELLLNLSTSASINAAGYSGNTPLHVAALSGYAAGVRVLLNYKANANLANHNGHTPLHLAATKGFAETASMLLKYAPSIEVNALDNKGRTALLLASEAGYLAVVKLLLEVNADKTLKDARGNDANAAAGAVGHQHVVAALMGEDAPAEWSYPEGYAGTAPTEQDDSTGEDSGWDTTVLPNAGLPQGSCPFERIDASVLTADVFVEKFLSLHRPVIIDGLLAQWPAIKKWTKKNFVKTYGNAELNVGKIPYAATYGFGPSKKMTARTFIKAEFGKKRPASPNYVFDAEILHRNQGLAVRLRIGRGLVSSAGLAVNTPSSVVLVARRVVWQSAGHV